MRSWGTGQLDDSQSFPESEKKLMPGVGATGATAFARRRLRRLGPAPGADRPVCSRIELVLTPARDIAH